MQALCPYVKVEYGDTDVTAQIEPYLTSLTYTDSIDGKEADKLTVALEDSQRTFQGALYPIKGSALYFEFGNDKDHAFKSGKGYRIDTISVAGAADTGDVVTWVASANIPSGAIHTRWCKAWADGTLEAIARTIAGKHDLDVVYDLDETVDLPRLDQVEASDLEFLQATARRYGLSCSVKAGKNGRGVLVVNEPVFRLAKPTVFTVTRRDCLDFSFDDCAAHNTNGCYVRWFDPKKKKVVKVLTSKDKSQVRDGLKKAMVPTLDGQGHQDRAVIRQALESYAAKPSNDERSAKLTLPGTPCLIAGVVVELPKDEWLANAGNWTVAASEHAITRDGGYKTTATLKRPQK